MQGYSWAQSKLRAFISILIIFLIVNDGVIFASCSLANAPSKDSKEAGIVLEKERKQIVSLGMREGEIFLVKEKIDLKNAQVNIPANVTIVFKRGGAIVNGTLNGLGTNIEGLGNGFLGVILKGTWCVEKVKDVIFSREFLSDTEIICNLNVIQSDSMHNEMTIVRDYLVTIPKSGGSGLILKSNTDLQLKGTLTLAPNGYKSYSIINIKGKNNVVIKGGKIVGDVGKHTYIEGGSNEWGMGININESDNVSIENMTITRCTGDGIYISGGNESSVGIYEHACHNVTIRNVICDANRRQGISVIHVDGLLIRDCSIINTGQIEFTPPGSGIDIEPNVKNNRNMSVQHVIVDDCFILGNKGAAVSTSITYEAGGRKNFSQLLFSNCRTDGSLKAQSTDLTFRNCTFKEARFGAMYVPTHITLEDCNISGGNGILLYAPSGYAAQYKDCLLSLDIKDCLLSVSESETETSSLISCYKSYIENIGYVNMQNCHLVIPRTQKDSFKLTDYCFNGKLQISASVIEMEGREFDASGLVLSNNEITCNYVRDNYVKTTNRIISR